MNPYSIPPFLVSGAIIGLGTFVLFKNWRSRLHQTWFLVCLSAFTWLCAYAIMYLQDSSKTLALLCARIGYTGVTFIPIAFYHFALCVAKEAIRRRQLVAYYAVSLVLASAVWWTPWIISGMERYFWGFYPRAGNLHPFYLFVFSLILVKAMWVLA